MASNRTSIHIEHDRTERRRDDRQSDSSRSNSPEPRPPRSTTSLVRTRVPSPESSRLTKRLIVCCDGTWLDSNTGVTNGRPDPPSNVTRLCRAIKPQSRNGIPQVVYYQAGVGSSGSTPSKVAGGATGDGVASNVREAYSFIANNYIPGDEIFLIGFSRGAFTARSVGGLIGSIGVLTREGLPMLPVVYSDFSHRFDRNYRSPVRDMPFPNKPPASSPSYAKELKRRGLTMLNIRIRAIAVFDTVGSLGIPRLGWLGKFGQKLSEEVSDLKFYDTTLDDCIDNAFQALALDERRSGFGPSLWEKRGNERTNLIQVWFPGVHSNVGGGYNDQELANITLAWMMAMLDQLLDFYPDFIHEEEKANADYYEDKGRSPRPWSFGKIYNSASGIYKVGGTTSRTPGDYFRVDPQTGETTNRPLRDTNEYIHASVRSRTVLDGPGYGGRGRYNSTALKGWRLRAEPKIKLPTPWFWEEERGSGLILPEAPMRSVERALLKSSPDVYDYIQEPPPPPPPPRGDRRSRSYG